MAHKNSVKIRVMSPCQYSEFKKVDAHCCCMCYLSSFPDWRYGYSKCAACEHQFNGYIKFVEYSR